MPAQALWPPISYTSIMAFEEEVEPVPKSSQNNSVKVNVTTSVPRPAARHSSHQSKHRGEQVKLREILLEVKALRQLMQSELRLLDMQLTVLRQQLNTLLAYAGHLPTIELPHPMRELKKGESVSPDVETVLDEPIAQSETVEDEAGAVEENVAEIEMEDGLEEMVMEGDM